MDEKYSMLETIIAIIIGGIIIWACMGIGYLTAKALIKTKRFRYICEFATSHIIAGILILILMFLIWFLKIK